LPLRPVAVLAVVLTALALVPAGAHLFALPNKLGLDAAAYFTVQGIYRGWALFGFVLIPAIAADLALAVLLRGTGAPFRLAAAGAALMAATLAIFFLWTFPANQATANWTAVPPDWERLRLAWEYAHAAGAILTFFALCAVTLAALSPRAGSSAPRA
jgi:hypothetical protein